MIGLQSCIDHASAAYHVQPAVIETVLAAPHPAGALGPMGIPTAWLPVLSRYGFSISKVASGSCDNIDAGAWIIALNPQATVSEHAPGPKIPADLPACAIQAADAYKVPETAIEHVLHSSHPTGSVGPMGIPVAWLPLLHAYGFSVSEVEHDPCRGMVAGVWIMAVENLQGAGKYVQTVHVDGTVLPPAWMMDIFKQAAARFSLPVDLLLAVADQESGFQPGVTSAADAGGIMQLIPSTATKYKVLDRYDASQSIMGGAAYLADLRTTFDGKLPLMLAAYNAGEAAVKSYGYAIPPFAETENYVPSVLAHMRAYEAHDVSLMSNPPAAPSSASGLAKWLSGSELHIPVGGQIETAFHVPATLSNRPMNARDQRRSSSAAPSAHKSANQKHPNHS